MSTIALFAGMGSDGGPIKPERIYNQHHGTHCYSGVGNIKRRPMPMLIIEIYKINHITKVDTIPKIAERTTQDQRQPTGKPFSLRWKRL